jgi:hypothetical protein
MNQPDRDGVWEIEKDGFRLRGEVHMRTNDIYLPTGEAPYRYTDFDDYNWTFIGDFVKEEMTQRTTKMIVTVRNCARCGNTHSDLEFSLIENPEDEWKWTAPCPENGQVIYMRVEEE